MPTTLNGRQVTDWRKAETLIDNIRKVITERDKVLSHLIDSMTRVHNTPRIRVPERRCLGLSLDHLSNMMEYGITEGAVSTGPHYTPNIVVEDQVIRTVTRLLHDVYAGDEPDSERGSIASQCATMESLLEKVRSAARENIIFSLEICGLPLDEAHALIDGYKKDTGSRTVSKVGNHVRMSAGDAWGIWGQEQREVVVKTKAPRKKKAPVSDSGAAANDPSTALIPINNPPLRLLKAV